MTRQRSELTHRQWLVGSLDFLLGTNGKGKRKERHGGSLLWRVTSSSVESMYCMCDLEGNDILLVVPVFLVDSFRSPPAEEEKEEEVTSDGVDGLLTAPQG